MCTLLNTERPWKTCSVAHIHLYLFRLNKKVAHDASLRHGRPIQVQYCRLDTSGKILFTTCTNSVPISGLVHLRNSAKILVLGRQLSTRIWVRAMIGPLESICRFANQVKGKFKGRISVNSLIPLGAQNKGLAASQTLPPAVRLHLRRRLPDTFLSLMILAGANLE